MLDTNAVIALILIITPLSCVIHLGIGISVVGATLCVTMVLH